MTATRKRRVVVATGITVALASAGAVSASTTTTPPSSSPAPGSSAPADTSAATSAPAGTSAATAATTGDTTAGTTAGTTGDTTAGSTAGTAAATETTAADLGPVTECYAGDVAAATTAGFRAATATTTADTTAATTAGTTGDTTAGTTAGTTGDTTAGTAHQTMLDPTTAVDINEQPRDALQQGGTLRRAIASLADNWNPNHPDGNQLDYADVLSPMVANTWYSQPDATQELDTDFVTAAEPNEDGTVVTYTLNPDAKWNSGDPITAADWKATWEALVDPANDVVSRTGYDLIDSVEPGADEFEVVVTFSQPYPDWQSLFDPVFPAASMENFNEGWLGEINPDWMTGPFTLGTYDAAQQVITLVPNENWWGEKPLLDSIEYRVVSSDATPTAFQNGEIDTFDIGPDPNGYAIASGTPGAEVRAAAGPNWRHFTMNTQAGNLTDPNVRMAIQVALDRSAIGESDLAGIPWPAQPLQNHVFMENQDGYQANGPAQSVDEAKAILEAGGWTEGANGIREKDGTPLTVKFSQITGVPVSENEARLAQAQLAEVGIQLEIVDLTQDNWSDELVAGNFEMIAFSWIGTPFPYPGISQLFGSGSDSNYAFSNIPELDALYDQAAVEFDAATRQDLANQIDQIIWNCGLVLPLYQRPELVAAVSNLANFGAFGFSDEVWEDVGYMS